MKTVLLCLGIFLFPFLSYNQQFPDFYIKNIDNQNIKIIEIKGSTLTILDFWATLCKPCVNSIPKLQAISEKYKEKGVQFIGVNLDSPRKMAKVKPFSNSIGINYPVIFDSNQELTNEYSITAIPTLIILDSNGNVLYTHEGFAIGDEKEIEKLLQGI